MCTEDGNLEEPTSARSTQVPPRKQPMVIKGDRFPSISPKSIVITHESIFLRPTEKRAIHTGHTQILRSFCTNLRTMKPLLCSCFYQRTSTLPNHKLWIKGWKRYEVRSIKVASSKSSGFKWKLEIKDMDGTRTILNQLEGLH